jgi:hypothetical protein
MSGVVTGFSRFVMVWGFRSSTWRKSECHDHGFPLVAVYAIA